MCRETSDGLSKEKTALAPIAIFPKANAAALFARKSKTLRRRTSCEPERTHPALETIATHAIAHIKPSGGRNNVPHPSEQLHWYDREGRPAYTVKAKDGSDRPTTLRDARKMNLVPSVTAIIRCAAAPGLEIWKQQQVLLAALTLPKKDGEAEKAYLDRILEDSKEQARKASKRGTEIHAAIQGFFQSEHIDSSYMPHVKAACQELSDWCGEGYDECCTVEKSFSHSLGFGGKVDICATSPMFVADFKTRNSVRTMT
jgi:hypothetical protein